MKTLVAASLALLVGFAQAACPKGCSGHGTCGIDEVVSLFSSLLSFSFLVESLSLSSPLTLSLCEHTTHSHSQSALAILDGARMVILEVIAPIGSVLSN